MQRSGIREIGATHFPDSITFHRGYACFKLHGSSNWPDPNGRPLLVMGGAKAREIGQNPILKWYAEQFENYLSRPDTKLMVIGYGFQDKHINDAIIRALGSGLKMLVIDPEGSDLAKRLNPVQSPAIGSSRTTLEDMFQRTLIGASRRQLRDIFGTDTAEYNKVMRFFEHL